MPYCPECQAEYRTGVKTCAHCEVELVAELQQAGSCTSQATMAECLDGKPVLAVLAGVLDRVIDAQEVLRLRGLPSIIVQPDELSGPGMHAVYQLAILEHDLEQARTIFKEQWRDGLQVEGIAGLADEAEEVIDLEAGGPITCPACGETFTPADQQAECPGCGIMLGVE